MVWACAGHIAWDGIRKVHYISEQGEAASDTLSISLTDIAKDVVWVEEHEIKYKGRMFDIKTQSRNDGVLTLTGHFDERDDKLFNVLDSLFGEDEEDNDAHGKRVNIWLCEAIMPEAKATLPTVYYWVDKLKMHFAQSCVPLYEPAAPFHPPIAGVVYS